MRPSNYTVRVPLDTFTLVGEYTRGQTTDMDALIECYLQQRNGLSHSKRDEVFIDNPDKLGALVDGQWVSYKVLLDREPRP